MGTYLRRAVDDELEELLASLPAILIEGPKGVGKTETAKKFAKTIKELDKPAVQQIGLADSTLLLDGQKPILLDEWQHVPQVWDTVRRAVDQNYAPNQYLLTGSASPSNPPTHSGAGRVVSLRMRPMAFFERQIAPAKISLSELLKGHKPALKFHTDVTLKTYVREMVQTGFPGMRQLSGRALRMQLQGYIQRILDRDFKEFGIQVRNPERIIRWMRAYAAASSTTASYETIRDASTSGEGDKLSKAALLPYRDTLERLWILESLPAWLPSNNELGSLAKPPKHQLADPGLAVHLLGLSEEALLQGQEANIGSLNQGTLLGALFESLVTLTIRVAAQYCESSVKHLRTTRGNREIDLIIERRDKKILACEVKLAAAPIEEDFKHLHWIQDKLGDQVLDRIMITTGPMAYRRSDGIGVIPLSLLKD